LEKEKLFRLTLKKFESQIPSKHVFRSHRSYLISRAQVDSVEGNLRNGLKVKLINSNQELPVSRSSGKELESIISSRKLAI
jgi:DNA-binding LytR/AlgR family response regulator